MAIKFLIDRLQQEEQETIAKILEVVKKKPYPDRNTEHLATFVHSLFQVGQKNKQYSSIFAISSSKTKKPILQQEIPKKEIVKEVIKYAKKPIPMPPRPIRSTSTTLLPPEQPIRHLEVPTPIEVPMPVPEEKKEASRKMEYTVLSFDNPIGIIFEPKDENNKPKYTVIEPQVSVELFLMVKELVTKDVSKDYKLLDNNDYIKEKCEKAAKRLKTGFIDSMLQPIKYFLKRDLTGFRKLDPLMQDLNVKAIYVDGINKPVIVETSQADKCQTNIVFGDPEELNGLIKKIAKATGNEISESKPILGTVFQGFKIQAILGIGNATSKLVIKKVMA